MPAKKNSTTTASAAPTAPTVPKVKKVRAKKTTSTSAPVEVAAPTPAPTPVEVATPTPVEVAAPTSAPTSVVDQPSLISQIESDFVALNGRLNDLRSLYVSITGEVKNLQKNITRHLKESSKKNRKRVVDPSKPPRPPSGFAKPSLISNALCDFLNKPEGTEMARTEVTKNLTQYIKQHSLQDEQNRRKILPDDKLRKLLNVGDNDEVTYFNLQKYMKVHFPKSQSAGSSA